MRVVRFDRCGGTHEPQVLEGDNPSKPAGGEVIVRVSAASINGTDLGLQRASGVTKLVMSRSKPGFDIAGSVVACGASVTSFRLGDRVMGLLGHEGGGQADFVRVSQRRLALIPDSISDVDAAALPLAALTALQALRGQGQLQAGSSRRVLINGAAGGIGSYAVQLAKLLGAHVTAVTSGGRGDYLRALGADDIRDRDDETTLDGHETYDLIFDVPGSLNFGDARLAVAPGGVLVSTHPVSADSFRLLRRRPERRFAVVTTSASGQDLSSLARLLESRRISSPIDRTFPVSEVADAYAHAASSGIRGKVVMTF